MSPRVFHRPCGVPRLRLGSCMSSGNHRPWTPHTGRRPSQGLRPWRLCLLCCRRSRWHGSHHQHQSRGHCYREEPALSGKRMCAVHSPQPHLSEMSICFRWLSRTPSTGDAGDTLDASSPHYPALKSPTFCHAWSAPLEQPPSPPPPLRKHALVQAPEWALNRCFPDFLKPLLFVVPNAGLGVCDALVEGAGGSFMSVTVHSVTVHPSHHRTTHCKPMPFVLM